MPQPGKSREARNTTMTTIKTSIRLSPSAATSRRGVRPASTPCSNGELPEGARFGQEDEVNAPAVVSHEDQSWAAVQPRTVNPITMAIRRPACQTRLVGVSDEPEWPGRSKICLRTKAGP